MLTKLTRFLFQDDGTLNTRSLRAGIWALMGRGAGQFLRFASNLILTRLLFPEAFGLMSLAAVVLSMVSIFAETGVRQALIQNPKGSEPEYLDTAWIISILRGLFLFVVAGILAKPMAIFYKQPELTGLIWLMSVSVLLQGFENPAVVLLTKKLEAIRQTLLELIRQIGGAVVTIIFAFTLRSVWALVIGSVAGAVVGLVASYVLKPYKPRLRWNPEAGRQLFHFGKYIFINTLITFAVMNGDRIILGRMLSIDEVGYFTLAVNLGLTLPLVLIQISGNVFFPAVSSQASDLEFVRRAFCRMLGLIEMTIFPLLAITAIFADSITAILYDPRYAPAGLALQWMGIRYLFFCIHIAQGGVFFAIGKPKYETISFGVGLVAMLLFLPIAVLKWGLHGAVIAICLSGCAITVTGGIFITRSIHLPSSVLLKSWAYGGIALVVAEILRKIIEMSSNYRHINIVALGVACALLCGWYLVNHRVILSILWGREYVTDRVAQKTAQPVSVKV